MLLFTFYIPLKFLHHIVLNYMFYPNPSHEKLSNLIDIKNCAKQYIVSLLPARTCFLIAIPLVTFIKFNRSALNLIFSTSVVENSSNSSVQSTKVAFRGVTCSMEYNFFTLPLAGQNSFIWRTASLLPAFEFHLERANLKQLLRIAML